MSKHPVNNKISRRKFLGIGAAGVALSACSNPSTPVTNSDLSKSEAAAVEKANSNQAGRQNTKRQQAPAAVATSTEPLTRQKPETITTLPNRQDFFATEILGRPTNSSVAVNVVPATNLEMYYEYGNTSGSYTNQTAVVTASSNIPIESIIDKLAPNSRYYYRVRFRHPGTSEFLVGSEHSFTTSRTSGSTFTFAIQGDSHPERLGRQFDPALYQRTMLNVAADQPDFFMTIGDDFSVDNLKTAINPDTVTERYTFQRQFLGLVGRSAPIFLANGNHEQASQFNLDGTPNNVAVWAQLARNRYYSQPAPDHFYSGNAQPVEHIGLLRDYYAWNWGDALFVVLDNYWHSPVQVDNAIGTTNKQRDMWGITIGDMQYQWLKKTLAQSTAKYKFVFAHHVNGTGRGGIERAHEYEWGGKGKNGVWEFDKMRPSWELPIHQLMAKYGVAIYFQGHDHLFARQDLDGVIYQTLPEPAHPFYTIENDDAYVSGKKLPNSGYLRITVAPTQAKIDYVRSYLPKDEVNGRKNGEVAYSYTIAPKPA